MLKYLINYIQLENVVPKDELGKNWIIFEIIAISLAVLPWIALIVYLCFFRKYYISYYFNGEFVYKKAYKKAEIIEKYNYQDNSNWYFDEDQTILFDIEKMPNNNLKVFARSEELKNE